jgi:hypothetical protein
MNGKSGLKMRICRLISLFIFLLFFTAIFRSWAFDEEGIQKTVSGIVVDLDWVKSAITVRYCDPVSGNPDEITVTVSNDTKITRGTTTISLSDIIQSDPVTIVYYDDGLSGLKAKKITDINLGNR